MDWRKNHRWPEIPEWIFGLKESVYPLRCHNCYSFPVVLVQYHDVKRLSCLFCKSEEV